MKVARRWLGLAVSASLGAGVVSGCGKAADGVESAGAVSCGAGEVALSGECLACDDARSDVREQLEASIAEQGWGRCDTDADCHSQEWSTPCDGQCNVAIAENARAAFEASLGEFVSRVCDPESWRASCGGPRDVDCAVDAHCIAGSCQIGGVPCGGRSEESCEGDEHCEVIRASPYDPAGGCFSSESVFIGCRDIIVNCRPKIYQGLDSEGRCFAFGNCLPPGFDTPPDGHPCQELSTCAGETGLP